jgi:hypothetical protein
MTATTVATIPADVWTAIGGVNPTAILISSNMQSQIATWQLLVAAAPPAATDRGHSFNAKDSVSLNTVTGQCYVKAEGSEQQFAVTT